MCIGTLPRRPRAATVNATAAPCRKARAFRPPRGGVSATTSRTPGRRHDPRGKRRPLGARVGAADPGREGLPLRDHPDDRLRPGPRHGAARDRPARHGGHGLPRLLRLLRRGLAPGPARGLDDLRALGGSVAFAVDEGLTGWVVSTRRAAFIRDNALDDPRFIHIRELEEEHFQSMVSVPVFSRAGDVIGVINLHTEAPREFARADLDFLEHTAALVAGAVENARPVRERPAPGDLADRAVPALARDRPGRQRLRAALHGHRRVPQGARRRAGGGLPGRLRQPARSAGRQPRAGRLARLDTARPARRRADRGLPALAPADVRALADVVWADGAAGVPMVVPLVAGVERAGILAVLCPTASPDALNLLSAIASHTAVALKHHELIGKLREENLVKDFVEGLSRPRRPHPRAGRAGHGTRLRPAGSARRPARDRRGSRPLREASGPAVEERGRRRGR